MNSSPQLFVTTFATGNRYGFATGKWFNLCDFSSYSDFVAAITTYAEEELCDFDPEICFSDFENFPKALYDECSAEKVFEWLELDEEHKKHYENALEHETYCETQDVLATAKRWAKKYVGDYESLDSFAYEISQEYLDKLPRHLANAIDWEAVTRHYDSSGYVCINGKVYTV